MDELLHEFVVESTENLQTIDEQLMVLERDPENPDALGAIFRAMHTIKGTAGFFDLPRIERLAHGAETLLGKLRDGAIIASVSHITALLIVADTLRSHLSSIETTESESDIDSQALLDTVLQLCEQQADAAAPNDASASPQLAVVPPPTTTVAPDRNEASDRNTSSDTTIRVDTGVLDDLMTLMGELVLARNELVQTAARMNDTGLSACTQRINHVTSDLRSRVVKTRMRPVRAVWAAIPRLARDTAVACGKQVSVRMIGEDTELDKTVLEAIKDPLTHCVRNSVDHGIEDPEARLAAGKSAEGTVTLRARHDNGNVVVEISDDGAGINVEGVRAKALEQGLFTETALAAMSDRHVANLIFAPGFSTAATVTNVSGRGVGMDVVRTNAERIGGTADVSFVPGQGTTFTITVPLTLAIIPALIVVSGEDRFAIPQASVLEVVRATADGSDIENLGGALVHRLRGALVALVDLRSSLNAQPTATPPGRTQIVILRGTGVPFGLIVDEILGNEEIVVRPLDVHYANVDLFAGATVMGDGKIALILDVTALGANASVPEIESAANKQERASSHSDEPTVPVLVVELDRDDRVALPLHSVARLEKFQLDDVELTGMERVVQYRDDILQLLNLSDLLGRGAVPSDPDCRFVVTAVVLHEGRELGLEVERIVEVAEAHSVDHNRNTSTQTAIANGSVIDVVTIENLFNRGLRILGVAA